MATTPSEGDDVLTGTKNDDTIYAGAGDDIVNSGAGDDTVYGGDGNDKINAGAGDDVLEGGAGDDILNGGGGSDTYVFNFTVNAGATTITYDATPADYDTNNNGVSQSEFSAFKNDYDAWLAENAPADYNYNQTSSDPVTSATDPDAVDGAVSSVTLTNGQTRYWEETIDTTSGGAPAITASDGYDTITQFQDAGPNVDKIQLNGLAGLSDEDLDTLFDLSTSDANGDGVLDTILSWDGGSITILGTSEWGNDVLAFLHDDQVLLT